MFFLQIIAWQGCETVTTPIIFPWRIFWHLRSASQWRWERNDCAPCDINHVWQVKEDLADLGFLDPGADLKELKRGTKYSQNSSHLDVQCWFNSILILSQVSFWSSMPIGRLELPQWMVEGLNSGRSPYLDVEVCISLDFLLLRSSFLSFFF